MCGSSYQHLKRTVEGLGKTYLQALNLWSPYFFLLGQLLSICQHHHLLKSKRKKASRVACLAASTEAICSLHVTPTAHHTGLGLVGLLWAGSSDKTLQQYYRLWLQWGTECKGQATGNAVIIVCAYGLHVYGIDKQADFTISNSFILVQLRPSSIAYCFLCMLL